MIEPTPPRPSFDTPEAVGVLRRYSDMALRDEIMPLPQVTGAGNTDLVREGKAAMWTDFATTRSIHARRMDLGLAPYPEATNAANPRTLYGFFVSAGSAHPEAADFDNWVGYISAYSPHPALCWDWLRYLSEHLVQGPGLPARRSLAGQVDLSQDAEKAACLSAMDQQNVHLNLWRDRSRNQALRSKAPTAATPSPG